MNSFLLYEQLHAVVTLTMNEPQTRNGSVEKFGIWAKTKKLIAIISRTYSARN